MSVPPFAQPRPSASVSAAVAAASAPAAPPIASANMIPPPSDVAAPPPDAVKTASGLVTKVLTKGTGKEHPAEEDAVKVHYTGWTKDGVMFDSSIPKNEPITFPLNQVIKGWTEGVALMVKGEKRRLWVPTALAYGDKPREGAPSGDLTFDVELLEIQRAPRAPEDVKTPPASAKKTASGLVYKVLKPGTGKDTPRPTDFVTVHYSGWTPDGKLFDSSVMRNEPLTLPVNGVIKGWTEGLLLMKTGEKARFWIPADLAYGDKPSKPGAPAGKLVFDVELLSIKSLGAPPPAPSR